MSSALAATPPAAPARPAAPERGTTTVADRVIVAVAARAAAEVPGIGGAARRVLGLPVDTDRADRAPRVEATIAVDTVALHLGSRCSTRRQYEPRPNRSAGTSPSG